MTSRRNKTNVKQPTSQEQQNACFICTIPNRLRTINTSKHCVVCTGLCYCLSKRGNTGNIRLPNDESCGMKKPTELEWACWSAVLWDVVRTWPSVALAVVVAGSDVGLAFACVCLRRSCFFCWSSSRILRFWSSCRAVGGWKAILWSCRCCARLRRFRFDVPHALATYFFSLLL